MSKPNSLVIVATERGEFRFHLPVMARTIRLLRIKYLTDSVGKPMDVIQAIRWLRATHPQVLKALTGNERRRLGVALSRTIVKIVEAI